MNYTAVQNSHSARSININELLGLRRETWFENKGFIFPITKRVCVIKRQQIRRWHSPGMSGGGGQRKQIRALFYFILFYFIRLSSWCWHTAQCKCQRSGLQMNISVKTQTKTAIGDTWTWKGTTKSAKETDPPISVTRSSPPKIHLFQLITT